VPWNLMSDLLMNVMAPNLIRNIDPSLRWTWLFRRLGATLSSHAASDTHHIEIQWLPMFLLLNLIG